MNWFARTLILGTFALAGNALAAAAQAPLDLHSSADDVNRQIQKINEQMADGKTYAEISVENRSKVREALGRITGALEASGGRPLNPEAENSAFNDQEIVNTLLTNAKEDSRLICERERQMGSNRIVSKCMSVAERRRLREQGQKATMDLSQRQLPFDPRAGGN